MKKITSLETITRTSVLKPKAQARSISYLTAFTLSALFCATAIANPFPDADLALGHEFHEDKCVACHAQRFDGEKGSSVYTRSERRVQSPGALTQQLTACTAMLNLDLFPEDEHHIAAYLNKHFYHFD